MTFILTFLLGTAALLIASGLDGSSLSDTFTKIIHNQPIDWTGTGQAPIIPQKGHELPGEIGTQQGPIDTTGTGLGFGGKFSFPAHLTPGKNRSCLSNYHYNATTGKCDLNNTQ